MKPPKSPTFNAIKGRVASILDWILGNFVHSEPNLTDPDLEMIHNLKLKDKVLVFVSYGSGHQEVISRRPFFNYFIDSDWSIFYVENGDTRVIETYDANFYFIKRGNLGRDLGAYRDLCSKLHEYSGKIVFVNSSIFWELSDIDRVIKNCEELVDKGVDIVGITDSYQAGVHHIQSYFFYFSAKSVKRGAHMKAFSHIKNWKFKRAIVRYGEMPILRILQESDFRISVIQPYDQLKNQFFTDNNVKKFYESDDYVKIVKRLNNGVPLNPTQHFAPILWINFQVLKVSFIRSNPANLHTQICS